VPRNLARISSIEIAPVDLTTLVSLINERIAALNRVFTGIEAEITQQKGNDGATPVFNNQINMRQHRITNGERSKDSRDFIIRQELLDLGLLGSADGRIVFGGEVEFAGGTIVSGPSGGTGVASGGDLADAVSTAIGDNVATSNDGDRLLNEQADGTNGTTPGTTVLALGPDGKARYLRLTRDGLRIDTNNIEELLVKLIEEIQGLKNELGH
jgi:hypothetical protein